MSYFRKRRGMGDDLPSPCDSDPESEVCRALAEKTPQTASNPVASFFDSAVTDVKALFSGGGAASGAAAATSVTKPSSSAASVAGLPIVPIAIGLGAAWFLFFRKGK